MSDGMQFVRQKSSVATDLNGVAIFISALWLVQLLNWLLPSLDLTSYGVIPRTAWGLVGIPLMPFLHGGWGHLISNTIPLCILLFILRGTRKDGWEIVASIIVLGGILLWCFGRFALHVGASGLIYGLITFLIVNGIVQKQFVPIVVSILVGFLYGSTVLFGSLPTLVGNVSWEGHLFGAIAGVITAYTMKSQREWSMVPE